MKQCPQCQANVSDTAKFCVKCGFNIKKYEEEMAKEYFCPECGTKFSGGVFCPECGYDVSGDLIDSTNEMADSSAPSRGFSAEAFDAFEYEEHSNGTYTITGLKDKTAVQYTVPQNVIAIADNVFEGCLAFNISLPEGLLKIGNAAFKTCKNLLTVNLPSSLVVIGDEAFADCEILDIELPATLRKIGNDATKNTVQYKKKQDMRKAELEKYSVGTIQKFGSYDKSKSGDIQPIEWMVLAQEGSTALLIAKNAISCRSYGSNSASWAGCYLREWLNSSFMNKAFSTEDKEKILNATLYTSGSNNTSDKIFILSAEEAKRYFIIDDKRRCLPTGLARAEGAYTNSTTGRCRWWLRDTEKDSYSTSSKRKASYINTDGSISSKDPSDGSTCIRPAMWIKI